MKINKNIKNNSKGFSHVEALIVIIVILAIIGAGLFVYNHNKKLNVAHADNWKSIASFKEDHIYACKVYSTIFGGVYTVSILYTKPSNWIVYSYGWQINRPNNISSGFENFTVLSYQTRTAFYGGTTALVTNVVLYGPTHDFFNAWMSGTNGTGAGSLAIEPSSLPNCT